jgi:hypothetical protein
MYASAIWIENRIMDGVHRFCFFSLKMRKFSENPLDKIFRNILSWNEIVEMLRSLDPTLKLLKDLKWTMFDNILIVIGNSESEYSYMMFTFNIILILDQLLNVLRYLRRKQISCVSALNWNSSDIPIRIFLIKENECDSVRLYHSEELCNYYYRVHSGRECKILLLSKHISSDWLE